MLHKAALVMLFVVGCSAGFLLLPEKAQQLDARSGTAQTVAQANTL